MVETVIGTQQSDWDFKVPVDINPSGIGNREYPFRPAAIAVGGTISDSNAAQWVERNFFKLRYQQEVGPSPDFGKMFPSDSEARFIGQMWRDLDELTESVRLSPVAELCRRFVEGVGTALALVPRVRCAVFGDEEDGVTLVAHSRDSMRQVSFEFKAEVNSINVVSIDEQMHRFERRCSIDKVKTLAEAIAWLNPR